jgi:hypothetical protein
MAADSKLDLPGDFQAGKTYLIKGDTLLAWRKALLADRVVPGPDQTETQTPQGRTISGGKGGAVAVVAQQYGAFWGLYKADGHTFLQGGTCAAGEGSETFADEKVIDANNGPTHPAGTLMVLRAYVRGYAPDGVLLGGLTLTSAQITAAGSMPSDSLPTATSPSGKTFHHELGRWTADGFSPSQSGNRRLSFCPGGGYGVSLA